MKTNPLVLFACAIIVAIAAIVCGCKTPIATTAINADSVVIQSVNASMSAWAAYVNAGKAKASDVASVSNAYTIYYNAQLIASNAASAYATNPTTNAAMAVQIALTTALLSQTNIIAIVSQLTK